LNGSKLYKLLGKIEKEKASCIDAEGLEFYSTETIAASENKKSYN
jgi:hypothetical protein